jgi:hypothetical protein
MVVGAWMNRIFTAVLLILIIITAAFVGIMLSQNTTKESKTPQAYVGVAFCGNSVADGKMMIDKVKAYTNLFVLQSGLLERDLKSVDELGDYAVDAGMYFLPYFGTIIQSSFSVWLDSAKQKWGSHLLGIYYADEPGGKMLDGNVEFKDALTGDTITKTTYGDVAVQKTSGIVINYQLGGIIHLYEPKGNSEMSEETFYPNGTVQIIKPAQTSFSYSSYQQLLDVKPFTDLNDTAERFIARDQNNIEFLKANATKIFTSDYALYWFDYLAGYDVVLGQVGWNLTLNQQIAQMRGAADAQNKSWGIVITWKYQQPPYLANGSEIFGQMRTAYECGAKYFVLFDYYLDSDNGTYGTMRAEHFHALQDFWNKVVNNSTETQGSVRANSVLVLPQNYGWGTRWDGDKIWGIFESDNKTHQIWDLMQSIQNTQGFNWDITFQDSKYPLAGNYQTICYADDSK